MFTIYLKEKGLIKEAEIHEKIKCNKVFEEDECKLRLHLHPQKGAKKGSVPSLKCSYLSIAKLGGFNNTKRTGIASCSTVWDGWSKYADELSRRERVNKC